MLHVVEHLSRGSSLPQVVVVLLLCKMAKRVGKQWSVLLLGLWLAIGMQTTFAVLPAAIVASLTAVASVGLTARSSEWYQTHAAVTKMMHPYTSRRPESQVIKRDVMDTLKSRIRDWGEHATIISGRYMAGKTVAVEEALRGTRGVFRFCIEVAEWKPLMYQELGVKDTNMFKQVLRRVRKRLAKHPDNPTKFPILLLDIPRETPTGRSLVSFKTINIKSMAFKVSSREAPRAWFLPLRRSLQAMQPVIFQLMSRPLLSKFEVGRSP